MPRVDVRSSDAGRPFSRATRGSWTARTTVTVVPLAASTRAGRAPTYGSESCTWSPAARETGAGGMRSPRGREESGGDVAGVGGRQAVAGGEVGERPAARDGHLDGGAGPRGLVGVGEQDVRDTERLQR